jgi:hypothetical protein
LGDPTVADPEQCRNGRLEERVVRVVIGIGKSSL